MNTVEHKPEQAPSASPSADQEPTGRLPFPRGSLMARLENCVLELVLAGLVLIPLIEIVARRTVEEGVPDSISWVRHLTLWVGFLGAAVAAREGRHLSLTFASFLPGRWARPLGSFAHGLAALVCILLALAALDMVRVDRESTDALSGILPLWIVELIIPWAFAVIGLRFIGKSSPGRVGRALCLLCVGAVVSGLAFVPAEAREVLVAPGLLLIICGAVAGTPIFAILGGAGLLLFYGSGNPIASVPAEAYRIASNAVLPSLPLFTLAGTILARGQASNRLVRVFRAWFGWVPGGTALAAVTVCAFFTTFTGGSGVTILALGGLMFPVLLKHGYKERFSLGLLTSSGSLGILFPPSLVIILYGVQAQTPIDRLFLAGIAPGFLLVGILALYAILRGGLAAGTRSPFRIREAAAALWEAKWEVALPFVVLLSIFSGYATLVEAASLTACYTFFVGTVIHRELKLRVDVPSIFLECSVMIGGILIILACAMGVTNYLIDAEIPSKGAEMVQAGITSPWVFLLALNGFLLVVGCLMDIFSAIVVVIPLLLPIADAFGIDRVHLGIIFLANMELGYLTPPVGMNLFVAALRFDRPVLEVVRASFPFLVVLLFGVLLITYVPWLTVGVVGWLAP